MYHKLGRPKRVVKAQMICIHIPGSNPSYYDIDDRGNIKKINEMKSVENQPLEYSPESENKDNDDQSLNIENEIKDEVDCLKLVDIKYLLNKKPLPSIIDLEIDDSFQLTNQPLVVC